jgi:hypothetical protein
MLTQVLILRRLHPLEVSLEGVKTGREKVIARANWFCGGVVPFTLLRFRLRIELLLRRLLSRNYA